MTNPISGATKNGESLPIFVDRKGKIKLSIEWAIYIIMIVNLIQAVGIAAILYTAIR